MICRRVLFVVATLFLGVRFGSAQDLSRYRAYVLESSLESVIAETGGRADAVRTLHERPAKIQEFEWWAPTAGSAGQVDPVQEIVFTFYNDSLYQVVVRYDRDRTDGLANGEIIKSLSALYGQPVLKSAGAPPGLALTDSFVLAKWESAASSLTLVRSTYSPEFQLVLLEKALSTHARSAIRQATRLDAIDESRRELERRKHEAADATAARDKARVDNRAGFRP
jgi:hypothetical protein